MDKKHLEALKEGYTFDANGAIRNPGKFEGETLATLYYYDAMLNGDGYVQMVAEDEAKEFGIDKLYVYVAESDSGFVSLVFCDTEEEAEGLESNEEEIEEEEEEEEEELEPTSCSMCGGDAYPLGSLGMLVHYRCINCGWTFSA